MNNIIISFEKNIGLMVCAILCYLKISNNSHFMEKTIHIYFRIFIVSIMCVWLDKILAYFTIPFIYFCIYITIYFNEKNIINSLKMSIISFSISYSVFILCTLIISWLVFVIPEELFYKHAQLLCVIVNIVIITLLFSLKRTRKGFTFVGDTYIIIPFLCFSVVMLLLAIILNIVKFNLLFVCVLIFTIIFSILLFLYWRTAITRHYLERLSLRNIDSLNAELVEKTNYIKELEEDKARIEKLNHKNYKLVPAMEGAVMHYLDGVKNFVESNEDNPAFAEFAAAKETDMAGFIDEGNRLLGELNKMLAEWEDIVHNDDIDGKKNLPVCGVTRVDYILSYMYERSLKENFVLKVDVDSELTGLTEKIITDEDLGTLIADLIENAIIATRYNNGKDILVRLGMMKKEYTIEVYDSGIPFDKEVLAKYGYEQITTHADESGSGIGMMQTYEILSKCGASLFIDEFAEGEGMYTKRISVVFNKKHQYVLYTKRSDEEVAYLKKRSDLMIVRK